MTASSPGIEKLTAPAGSADRPDGIFGIWRRKSEEGDTLRSVDLLFGLAQEVGSIRCTSPDPDCLRFETLDGTVHFVPLRHSKPLLRAFCARLAVICSERTETSVSPYGDDVEINYGIGFRRAARFRVRFENTTSIQWLEIVTQSTLLSVRHLLEEFVKSHSSKATCLSSCTFYVRDPLWPEEYRLLFMPGVTVREPMHGFMFPPKTRDLIATRGEDQIPGISGGFEHWHSYSSQCDRAEPAQSSTRVSGLESIRRRLSTTNPVFGSFAERENIESYLCLQKCDDGERGKVAAVLFLNFKSSSRPSESVIQLCRTTFAQITELLPDVTRELAAEDPRVPRQLLQLLHPVEALLTSGVSDDSSPHVTLRECLNAILDSCFLVLGLDTNSGLGTIHLLNVETATLELKGHRGRIDRQDDAMAQSLDQGDGVIAWVALKQQSLLIRSFAKATPEFTGIHRSIRDGVQSELAVPMLAGQELLGVLNLESTVENAFSAEMVRAVWHAANQAAIAVRLFKEISESREQSRVLIRLLRIASDAPRSTSAARFDELAELMRDALKASRCHIWRTTPDSRFESAGSTGAVTRDRAPRRSTGWTAYICEVERPVCIVNIDSEKRFDAFSWNPVESVWELVTAGKGVPTSIHEAVMRDEIQCEFGIPILDDDRCFGVAWLKYEQPRELPRGQFLSLAEGLAGELALVFCKYKSSRGADGIQSAKLPSKDTLSKAELLIRRAREMLNEMELDDD